MGRGQERRQVPSEEAVVALQMEEDGGWVGMEDVEMDRELLHSPACSHRAQPEAKQE